MTENIQPQQPAPATHFVAATPHREHIMKRIIAVAASVTLAVGLSTATANADDPDGFTPTVGYDIVVDLDDDDTADGALLDKYNKGAYILSGDASPELVAIAEKSGLLDYGTWSQWRSALPVGSDVESRKPDEPYGPTISAEFTDTRPGQTTAVINAAGDKPASSVVEVVKHNPRNGRERVVDRKRIHSGEYRVTVNFPKAKRWQQVYVYVDGRPLDWRMVEVPESQWPRVKPRLWATANTWFRNAEVWVHADQPQDTRAAKRGTFYRVQVVRNGRVRTVRRGRLDQGDSDRARLRIRGHRNGPQFVTVRVKSRGQIIEQRRMRIRWNR